ncbi:MAG: dihydrofolate reductase family protein [Longimicrobiales bacterium]
MRRIRYQVACSLDGYITGPNGEIDWITHDPDIDFGELFSQFDTLLMGRRTYEEVRKGAGGMSEGLEMVVVSRTLRQQDHPAVTIVSDHLDERIDELRARPGKDIWLFGGGELLRSLLATGRVDTVEPAIIPVLLGGGRPFLAPPPLRARLSLNGHRIYEQSGIVFLEYAVLPATTPKKSRSRKKRSE